MIFEEGIFLHLKASLIVELKALIEDEEFDEADRLIEQSIQKLHRGIPDKKRSSYGIVYVVKTLAKEMYGWLETSEIDAYDFALSIYKNMSTYRTICVGLGILSHIGVKNVEKVIPVIEEASVHEIWEVREFVQMYIRKMTKKNKVIMQEFLIGMAQSESPLKRRFASEGLRPVTENRWINQEPEFSLKVLEMLYTEAEEFPRTSVGNNLSDLARKQPELILRIVKTLVSSGNPNSVWIATRACRNLIKTDKERVLDILGTDSYTYKGKTWIR